MSPCSHCGSNNGGEIQYVNLGAVGPQGPQGPPGPTDHGALTGKADNDHPQYALLTGANFTGSVTTAGNLAANAGVVAVSIGNNGNGSGATLSASANTNGATPAPGAVRCYRAIGGGSTFLFPDDSNIWRLTTVSPTFANYATANVVGAQSSSLDQKDVLGAAARIAEIFLHIAQAAEAVRRFQYKRVVNVEEDGSETLGARPYNGEEFSGIIVDYAPRYGMDKDDEHPAGKSLNTINAIGDLMLAVNALRQENDELRARLEALEGK